MKRLAIAGLMVVAVVLVGCTGSERSADDSGSPGRRFLLSSDQISELSLKAQQGDVKAAIKLANHYQWAVSDQANATIWLKKGVELGDPWAMINLSSITAMEGGESRCKEAEALLQKVLEKPGPAEAIASARSDLEILRSGVNGSGYCVKWLGGKK